jgi:hypothetical protein
LTRRPQPLKRIRRGMRIKRFLIFMGIRVFLHGSWATRRPPAPDIPISLVAHEEI